ncbi:hypothetical protein [uncultured Tenacibaculum sp.]|uniref:hypothetical protein n=1 Tax=uncultured Tenacibaculum sp. TaxID=174713 RepID=UPI002623F126|nr:hypothetical protein [uncultured Tenacibaculum sp.]
MNFKNLAENLIIVLISVAIGGYIGYKSSIHSNKQTIELLRPAIVEAIKVEKTVITNEFQTYIRKLKNKNGNLDFNLDPSLESQIKQQNDTIRPKKRKRFLGIF